MVDYSNTKFEITILTDRIFKLKPYEDAELDVEDIQEMRSIFLKLSKNENFAVLLDASANVSLSHDARALLASNEYAEKRIAAAFVTRSLANKLIGNFFIQFNKPPSPTKMFNEEAPAFEWLKEQVQNELPDTSARHNSK